MAVVKYGAIVTELKGKIGGQVFQGGNNSYILRNKGYTPGNPSAARQLANRYLAANARLWRSLSGGSVASWNAIVASWPFKDRFGTTYYANGFQVFMAWNCNLNSLGLPSVHNATGIHTPTDPGAVVLSSPGGATISLDWDNAGGANDYFMIFASPKLSNGVNNNYRRYRLVDFGTYNGSIGEDFTSQYTAAWSTLVAGDVVSCKWLFYARNWPIGAFGGSALVTIV